MDGMGNLKTKLLIEKLSSKLGGQSGADGFPGGIPNCGSFERCNPQTGGMGNLYKLLQDPETLQTFQDPEVEAAFKDISANPAKLASYQNNPKIKAVIEKFSSKFGSQSGAFFKHEDAEVEAAFKDVSTNTASCYQNNPKIKEVTEKLSSNLGSQSGFPGGVPPGGMGNLYNLLKDPEILQAFQDPEVEAAFKVISTNPAKLSTYQNNPKIKAIIEKLSFIILLSKLGSQIGAAGFKGVSNFGGFGVRKPPTGGIPEEDSSD